MKFGTEISEIDYEVFVVAESGNEDSFSPSRIIYFAGKLSTLQSEQGYWYMRLYKIRLTKLA